MAKAKTEEPESLFNSDNTWLAMAAVAALVVICVVVRGCRSETVPAGPPVPAVQDPGSSQSATMAVIYVPDSYRCVACDWLKSDMKWLEQKHGWRDSWRFQTDNRGQSPRIEFYRGGSLVNEVVGYSTSPRWEDRRPFLKAIVDQLR